MRTIKRDIATIYVISSDGKLLLGKKRPKAGGVYPDKLHNPGGGIEAGESGEQAARRELLEETGIDSVETEIILVDNQGSGIFEKTLSDGEHVLVDMKFNVYKCLVDLVYTDVTMAENDDLVSLAWYPVADVRNLPLTPPALELFERIGTDWLRR